MRAERGDLRIYGGRQVAMFCKKIDQHVPGALHFVRIVLRLDNQAHLLRLR